MSTGDTEDQGLALRNESRVCLLGWGQISVWETEVEAGLGPDPGETQKLVWELRL